MALSEGKGKDTYSGDRMYVIKSAECTSMVMSVNFVYVLIGTKIGTKGQVLGCVSIVAL